MKSTISTNAGRQFSIHFESPGRDAVHWPDGGTEEMEFRPFVAHFGSVTVKGGVGRVIGGRKAFGRQRVRIHVIVQRNVQVEFVETDDYEVTKELVAVLKKPGGNRHATSLSDVPEDYHQFRMERFSARIRQKRAFRGLAVVVREDEVEAMAQYGLLRWRDRKQEE